MNNRSSNSYSSLFLMEMMIAIMLFSLASAVCLRMFAICHQIGENTKNLNMAVYQAENVAELLRNALESPDEDASAFPNCIKAEFPLAAANASAATVYYDGNWQFCGEQEGEYCMEIIQSQEESLALYDIQLHSLDSSTDMFYSLLLKLHQPQRP